MNDTTKDTQNENNSLSEEKRVKIQESNQETVSKATPSTKKSQRAFKFSRRRDGRVAFKKRRKLGFDKKRDGFHYHWMNEDENDFLQLKKDGWAFVDDKSKAPRDCVRSPAEDGSIVRRSVGGGKYAYLMCTPQEWRDEAEAEKQEENDRIMSAIGKTGLDCIPVDQITGDVKIINTAVDAGK